MKMLKKSKLTYQDGYILDKKGRIVCVDNEVVDLLNQLEEDVQRAAFERYQDEEHGKAEAREEFVRKSEHKKVVNLSVKTPNLDELVEKAEKVMGELDAVASTEKAKRYLDGIEPVIQFASQDFVIACENAAPHRFDLPFLENPLELDVDDIVTSVMTIFM